MIPRHGFTTPSRRGSVSAWLNLVVFVAGLLALGWSVTYLAHRPLMRAQVDATRTRAYSLSDQSRAMLATLEGEWHIALVCVRSEVDAAALRQVEEVLARYAETAPALSVELIDPTRADDLPRYEDLIRRLRAVYGQEVDSWEQHIARGLDAYRAAVTLAQREVETIAALQRPIDSAELVHRQLERARTALSLIGNNGPSVVEEIERSMQIGSERPIPDFEFARDTIVAALTHAASVLVAVSREFEPMVAVAGIPVDVRAYLAERRVRLGDLAVDLQRRADPLIHLKPLELSRIGRELERGSGLVICGPRGCSVVPASQVLPHARRASTGGSDEIVLDQRFRGEEVISAAMRGMVHQRMPLVVFVHAQSDSPLQPRSDGQDVSSLARALRGARFEVVEWSLLGGHQPAPEVGRPVAWVILPPPFSERAARLTFATMREERLLIDAAVALLDDGQPVLLPFYPSLLHGYSQPDPWQELGAMIGVEVDTSRILSRRVIDAQGGVRLSPSIDLVEPRGGESSAISSAIHGQPMHLPLPVPLRMVEGVVGVQEIHPILWAEGGADVFLDPQWTAQTAAERVIDPSWRVNDAVLLAAGVERVSPRGRGGGATMQRIVVVGSVNWMHSPIIDAAFEIDRRRSAPVYPGNAELMQQSCAWLAGMDDLIARSPSAGRIARLEIGSPAVRRFWGAVILLVMPVGCLLIGGVVWLVRNGRSPLSRDARRIRVELTTVVAVALGALGVFVGWRVMVTDSLDRTASETRFALFAPGEMPVDSIQRVTLARRDRAVMVFERRGAEWEQVEPVVFRVDPFSVRRFAVEAASLEAVGRIEGSGLGFDPPLASLTLEWDGGRRTIHFGMRSVGGRAYLKLDDDPTVYVVDRTLHDRAVDGDEKGWRLRTLLRHAGVDSTRVEFQAGDGAFALERQRRRWTMSRPFVARLDAERMDEYLAALESARLDGFVLDQPDDLSQFGLQSPFASFTVASPLRRIENGQAIVDEIEERILFGSPAGSAGESFYAMIEGGRVVFTVGNQTLAGLLNVEPLVELTASGARASDVFGLRITTADEEFDLQRDQSDPTRWTSADHPDASINAERVDALLRLLSGTRATTLRRSAFDPRRMAAQVIMFGLDLRPIDTVRFTRDEVEGGWWLDNGEGIERFFPDALVSPLSSQHFGLGR